jgi:CDP-diacylglycerol--serine O-phosphatidyltransferase
VLRVKIAPPDGSRDPRIEDPTNLYFVHLVGRALLPGALQLGISANLVSLVGLLLGTGAAWAYLDWRSPLWASIGFLLTLGWLIADGMDGMIARARGSASQLGRFMDGLCDHGVFLLLYLALAASIGTVGAWVLAVTAGLVHGVQAMLFEGERMRFQRRIRGEARLRTGGDAPPNLLVRLYDSIAGSFDRAAEPFERLLGRAEDPAAFGQSYGDKAWRPLRFLSLLSNNRRVILIYVTAMLGDITLFWWIELVLLTIVAAIGIVWHRRVEREMVGAGEGAWTPATAPGMIRPGGGREDE